MPTFSFSRLLRALLIAPAAVALIGMASPCRAQSQCAVFVSTTGTDTPTGGLTPATALRTINFALARAAALGRTCVLVRAGTYAGGIDMLYPGLSVRGGFDAQWQSGTPTDPSHLVTVRGGFHSGAGQYLTVRAFNLAQAVKLADLTVVAPNAAGTFSGTGSGNASYGIVVQNCAGLELERVTVVGGTGAAGVAGVSGTNASQTLAGSGGAGGDADEYTATCDATSRGARGAAGANNSCAAQTAGGQGGLGGTMDTECGLGGSCQFGGNCNATAGSSGVAGAQATGTFGNGGLGGSPCGTPVAGTAGRSVHGSGGTGGVASLAFLSAGNWWITNSGSGGSLGTDGGGGGGGGASGGCDTGVDSYGAGGGGGGAGGCRAPVAGTGGGGGGASICLLSVNTPVTVTSCTFVRGTGGAGGTGGASGAGQPGGPGGPGGLGVGDSNPGGAGGDGGRGGHSGSGGGGAGGNSVAILRHLGSLTSVSTTFSGGIGGAGGAPGAGVGGLAQGTAGQVGSVGGTVVAGPQEGPARSAPQAIAAAFPTCNPVDCFLDAPEAQAVATMLMGATPNPLRDVATIRFSLATECDMRLELFDVRGGLVRTLTSGRHAAGVHSVTLAVRGGTQAALEPGIYFIRMVTPGRSDMRRTIIVR